MQTRTLKTWGVLGICLGSALACNQLLGIDEAGFDARLESNAGSLTNGGNGGTSGSEAQSGSAGTTSSGGGSIGSDGSGGTVHQHNTDSHAGEGGDDGLGRDEYAVLEGQ